MNLIESLRRHEGDTDEPWRYVIMDKAADEIERLRADMKWISEQRWNEDADLDEICTRADRAFQQKERTETK